MAARGPAGHPMLEGIDYWDLSFLLSRV